MNREIDGKTQNQTKTAKIALDLDHFARFLKLGRRGNVFTLFK
jgi:hypothetical protein